MYRMSTRAGQKHDLKDQAIDIRRLQMAMGVSLEGVWEWKIDTDEMRFDRRLDPLAEYDLGSFPTSFDKFENRVHSDDILEFKTRLADHFKARADIFETQFRYRSNQGGNWIWMRVRGKALERDKAGRPTRMIGTYTDITELKEAESVCRKSEENYRLFVENAHDGIFIIQDRVIKYANPSTERVLGYSPAELSVKPFTELIHPDDRQMVLDRHKSRLAGKKVPNYYSFRIRTKAGEERRLELNAVRINWENRPAILGFIRDITEMQKLEQQLVQSQKMQAIGTLAGGIAHDFNNILSAMMGYTELSQMEAPTGSKLAGRLERVLQAGHRARDLVNQILAFSRQEETGQKPVQVGLIVKEALKLMRASIPGSIEFAEQIDPDTGAVMADPTRIHQIIMNLCTNAAHAMQADGGTLEVRLCNCDVVNEIDVPKRGLLKPGPYLRLTVSDSGHGMDAETIKRIFDPYFTTKRQGEGTGLGLSVIHGIVAGMHGTIDVTSEPGEGATFQVYLPRIEADLAPEVRHEVPLPRGSETILLVENEELILEMTTELLEKLDYTVVSRNSSVEAIQAFQAMPNRFDLVITDHNMPKLTGLELAARIRQIRDDIPVILTTGFSAGIDGRKMDAVNIQAVLNKPVLKHELAAAIRMVLDQMVA